MAQPVLLLAGAVATVFSGWLAAYLSGPEADDAGRALAWSLRLLPLPVAAALYLAGTAPALAAALACAPPLAISAAVLDWREGSIADAHSIGIAIAGLVAAPSLHPHATWTISLGGGVLAAGILALGNLLILVRTRKHGLGTGDYGLAAAGGVWCGLGWVGPALLVAVTVTVALAMLNGGRIRGMQDRLAFAPGLVTGFAAASLAGRLL